MSEKADWVRFLLQLFLGGGGVIAIVAAVLKYLEAKQKLAIERLQANGQLESSEYDNVTRELRWMIDQLKADLAGVKARVGEVELENSRLRLENRRLGDENETLMAKVAALARISAQQRQGQ